MKRYSFVLLITLLTAFNLQPQNRTSFITDSLDQYIFHALNQWQIPGAAVLIVKDGKIAFSKGYGVRELGKQENIDEITLFMIGSNTKAFTGTAIALLEFEGKLKLEDKVTDYLPSFVMKDACITKELNLVDIVSHRMGFDTFQGDFMYWTSDLTSSEVLQKFGQLTPMFSFRAKYGYTNAGYAVAGKIIEKVSGVSWAEFIKEKFFVPLEMNRTLALSEEYFKAENAAKPHTVTDGKTAVLPFQNIDNLAPAGSIGSSINDLSHWIIAQLDSGRFKDREIIPDKVLQRTRKPESIQGRVKRPFNTSYFNLYGLGWGLSDYEGKEIISHTGGVNGFLTSVTLLPEEKLGIVVLTNTDQNLFYQSVKWEIIDCYLNLPFRNYDSVFYSGFVKQQKEHNTWLNAVKDSVRMKFKPKVNLSEFEGKYEHDIYGHAELKKIDDYLELSLQHHSKLKGKLEYIGNDRFLCTYSDPTYGMKVFDFELENNKVNAFTLYVDDFIERFGYKFSKKPH